ncbi:putative nuclease HARBI1 [Cucumis melo var. makuwa]|uniref:Putative nuclease HARBI1 n=1 Tax=Cucumis melo var. makuwa TaxID=1194695 RepID=A0A5D3CVA5_CUCMM|nr:putative nuclease HARBI1 [Cucumis melo var. makuwa]
MVLMVVLRLHDDLLATPQPIMSGCTDMRNCVPYLLQNCLGALDSTYFKVNVSAVDRYHTRKGKVATNVLDICDTKGNFVFILAGWDGLVADSRILRDALSRSNDLKVPKGEIYFPTVTRVYYYLCSASYPKAEGFLSSYRGQRYHLQE